ncbi:MAG: aminotransferase class V-fold PLP-dependent enzyme [Hyphomonas sp.]
MNLTRRNILQGAAASAAALQAISTASAAPIVQKTGVSPGAAATDEAYWKDIAAQYDVTPDVLNFENGYWGLMARPVLDAFLRHTEYVNRQNSWYARRQFNDDLRPIHARLAEFLGAGTDEIVFTRGATEALQAILRGYNRLKAGDAVMYADVDYDSIQTAMETLAEREGCSVVRLEAPEPAGHDEILDFYRRALDENPRVRLLLLTHISHRNGLKIPVREIVEMARAREVDCVVDAAHSWGQTDFRIEDLGADFAGFNLHKWIGGPIGAGLMYIRRTRLNAISPDLSERPDGVGTIHNRIHTGTTNFATFLTLGDALDFHQRVGPENKAARLSYLRDLWVGAVRDLPGLGVLTQDDPRMHAGITSFRVAGKTSVKDNQDIVARLIDEHGIFTTHRAGLARGACVRVTPSLYTRADDCLQLAGALKALVPNL